MDYAEKTRRSGGPIGRSRRGGRGKPIGVMGPRNQPRPKGRSFSENDVKHAIQPISCFAGRHRPPQASPSDSHG